MHVIGEYVLNYRENPTKGNNKENLHCPCPSLEEVNSEII
jgi:hypothetical protein